MHSRWLETGAGRADVQLSGGDSPSATAAAATVNECWSEDFLSVYKNVSYDPTLSWGQEQSCTAFPTAAYSSLN